jgi:hypothetical protein
MTKRGGGTSARTALDELTAALAEQMRLVHDLEQERLQLRVRLTVLTLLLR